MRLVPLVYEPNDLPATTRHGNIFHNLLPGKQRMVRVLAHSHGRRMPLWPVRRRRDEIEDLLDGPAYFDAIRDPGHSDAHPKYRLTDVAPAETENLARQSRNQKLGISPAKAPSRKGRRLRVKIIDENFYLSL